jgi:hypothetical protein
MSRSNSNPQPSTAKVARSRRNRVARIAREIVDLVERTDGPVPLNRIDEQVGGFSARSSESRRSYSYFIRHNTGEVVIWNGLTKAGCDALQCVLHERKVALQFVNVIPYLFENVRLLDPDWQPVVLLPVRAANIDGPKWAFRLPPALVDPFMTGLGADGRYRPLVPQQVGSTADRCWDVELAGP